MENKILSISVAAYNVEKFIDRTLSSLIVSREYIDKLDVIVVDDGSKDKSFEIAQKYADRYPESFRIIKKENGGHGSTLNVSVREAKGKYFKMLDGDDWYDKNELESLIKKLEDINVDIVLCPYNRVYEISGKNELINRHNLQYEKEYTFNNIGNNMLEDVHAAEMTVRTNVLKNKEFRISENCAFTDDEYVFEAILYAKTYMKLKNVVYQYRIELVGQTVSEHGRKKYWLDAGHVATEMTKKLAMERDSVICEEHLQLLTKFIKKSIEFQCQNFAYADDMGSCEEEYENFTRKLQSADKDFFEYIKKTSFNYNWWKWLFSVKGLIEDNQCMVFGAGKYAERIEKYLKSEKIEILCFLDNNESFWGKNYLNKVVLNPQDALKTYKDTKIIIAIKNHPEQIEQQLLSMGVSADRIIMFRK